MGALNQRNPPAHSRPCEALTSGLYKRDWRKSGEGERSTRSKLLEEILEVECPRQGIGMVSVLDQK